MNCELKGVPYTSAREPGGIAEAIDVLRQKGLAERLRGLGAEDAGDLTLEEPSGVRGASGLLNERALGRLVDATGAHVRGALARQRFPLLVGGDCPVLLGALEGIRDSTELPGLVMLDGHEDAWPPKRSETGEASDSEVAIALGMVAPLPDPLSGLVPLTERSRIAALGPRDRGEIEEAGVESLRGHVAFFADDEESGREGAIDQALRALDADAFWLHIDLDVLGSVAFPAVDYPQPGGWAWETLDRCSVSAALDRRCRGISIVIYNPDLDPARESAERLVDFVSRLVAACLSATPTP